jgi:hypothetical protein
MDFFDDSQAFRDGSCGKTERMNHKVLSSSIVNIQAPGEYPAAL